MTKYSCSGCNQGWFFQKTFSFQFFFFFEYSAKLVRKFNKVFFLYRESIFLQNSPWLLYAIILFTWCFASYVLMYITVMCHNSSCSQTELFALMNIISRHKVKCNWMCVLWYRWNWLQLIQRNKNQTPLNCFTLSTKKINKCWDQGIPFLRISTMHFNYDVIAMK